MPDTPMTAARLDEIDCWLAKHSGLRASIQAALEAGATTADITRMENDADAAADWIAEIGAPEMAAEIRRLRAEVGRLRAGADERIALLEAARDVLYAAGINQAHGGDTWPRIDDSIEELAQQRDQARADADRYREEHAEACALLVAVYQAAVGHTNGTTLGFVADVEEVRTELLDLRARLAAKEA
ncbi:hypothetical protein [Streptodolium elevatio]|uniref:Uncharacterized protein n=1 Tax=Streptodolium elevatio TaxID=3157996 RepID=A0ABV3DJX6_9ACTN